MKGSMFVWSEVVLYLAAVAGLAVAFGLVLRVTLMVCGS